MERIPMVYVIDDDQIVRRATASIVMSMRLRSIEYTTAEEFLGDRVEESNACLVTDQRLPGMSGLDLLRHLQRAEIVLPVIVISGFSDTPVAVDAMKAGAVTFLEKSQPPHRICEAISAALQLGHQLLAKKSERERLKQIKQSLSADELQVLYFASRGKLNKEIATEVGVQIRTIEARRCRLMTKIGAESFADLMRFALRLEDYERSLRQDEFLYQAS